jgi:hypothetical protein
MRQKHVSKVPVDSGCEAMQAASSGRGVCQAYRARPQQWVGGGSGSGSSDTYMDVGCAMCVLCMY